MEESKQTAQPADPQADDSPAAGDADVVDQSSAQPVEDQVEPAEAEGVPEQSWQGLIELLESGDSKALKRFAKRVRKVSDADLVGMLARAKKCEAAEAEVGDAKARLFRVQADFDNSLKRMERRAAEDMKYASKRVLEDLLPTIDNLQRAIDAARTATDPEALLKGVEMTATGLVSTMSGHGLHPIDAAGQPFDPEFHEAVLTGADPDKPDGEVLDCFERGWRLNDRVLRPAKVRVNKLG